MPTIDLSSSQGNAFALFDIAYAIGRQLGHTKEQTDATTAKLRGGDYHHLLTTMEAEFPGVEFEFLHDPRVIAPEPEPAPAAPPASPPKATGGQCEGSGQPLPADAAAEFASDPGCTHFWCPACGKLLALPSTPQGLIRKHKAPKSETAPPWPFLAGVEAETVAV